MKEVEILSQLIMSLTERVDRLEANQADTSFVAVARARRDQRNQEQAEALAAGYDLQTNVVARLHVEAYRQYKNSGRIPADYPLSKWLKDHFSPPVPTP